MTNLRKTRKAFTIAELLVAVATLGILAAGVFAVYANVVDASKQATCKDNAATLTRMITNYVSAGGYFNLDSPETETGNMGVNGMLSGIDQDSIIRGFQKGVYVGGVAMSINPGEFLVCDFTMPELPTGPVYTSGGGGMWGVATGNSPVSPITLAPVSSVTTTGLTIGSNTPTTTGDGNVTTSTPITNDAGDPGNGSPSPTDPIATNMTPTTIATSGSGGNAGWCICNDGSFCPFGDVTLCPTGGGDGSSSGSDGDGEESECGIDWCNSRKALPESECPANLEEDKKIPTKAIWDECRIYSDGTKSVLASSIMSGDPGRNFSNKCPLLESAPYVTKDCKATATKKNE